MFVAVLLVSSVSAVNDYVSANYLFGGFMNGLDSGSPNGVAESVGDLINTHGYGCYDAHCPNMTDDWTETDGNWQLSIHIGVLPSSGTHYRWKFIHNDTANMFCTVVKPTPNKGIIHFNSTGNNLISFEDGCVPDTHYCYKTAGSYVTTGYVNTQPITLCVKNNATSTYVLMANATVPANNRTWYAVDWGNIFQENDYIWSQTSYGDDYRITQIRSMNTSNSLYNEETLFYDEGADTTPPTFSNNETNATISKINGNATFNITISDDTALKFYIFSWNGTGIWDNATNGTISGLTSKLVINKSTSLSQGNTIGYIWYANDTNGNLNNSLLRTFKVVNTIPDIPTLLTPADTSSVGLSNTLLSFNSTDADNATDIITFYIYNSTDNSEFDLLFNGSKYGNSTYNWTDISDGIHYWKVKAGDGTDNSSNSTSFSFTVSSTSPSINLNFPTTNQYFNTRNISLFNFTATDTDGLSNCSLWHNLSGTFQLNQTTETAVSGSVFIFNQTNNLTDEGSYVYNVFCNDSAGNGGFAPNNFTFFIDTVQPNISLTQPSGTKTSRTVTSNWIVSDFALDSCKYNVFRGTSEEVSDTTVTCGLNTTNFVVTVDADFTFNFTSTDLSGNVESSLLSFTVDTTGGGDSPSGGGGSTTTIITDEQAIVEALEEVTFCGNNVCQVGENPLTCPQDCPANFDELLCPILGGGECKAWVFNFLIWLIGGTIVFILFKKQRGEPIKFGKFKLKL